MHIGLRLYDKNQCAGGRRKGIAVHSVLSPGVILSIRSIRTRRSNNPSGCNSRNNSFRHHDRGPRLAPVVCTVFGVSGLFGISVVPAFPGAIHCRTFQLSIQQVVTGSNPVDPTIEAWNPDVFKTSGFQAFRLQTRSGYRPDCVSDGLVLFGPFRYPVGGGIRPSHHRCPRPASRWRRNPSSTHSVVGRFFAGRPRIHVASANVYRGIRDRPEWRRAVS